MKKKKYNTKHFFLREREREWKEEEKKVLEMNEIKLARPWRKKDGGSKVLERQSLKTQ